MIQALATPRNRKRSLTFLAAACLFVIGAAVVGVADNPPGIALAFLSTTAFVLSVAHPWRRPRQFAFLLLWSLLGLVVLGILHNLFEAVAGVAAGVRILQVLLQGLGGVAFLAAVLLCPPAILVGAIGSLVTLLREPRVQKTGTP